MKFDGKISSIDFRAQCSALRKSRGFTLIEIMIVAVLLTVIILGLLAMFQQTQKAFRVGLAQTDVLEAGRATSHLLARELEHVTPSGSAVNFFAWIPFPRTEQDLPASTEKRTNYLEELFFLRRENQTWIATGYRVGTPNLGIGSLYRYETNCPVVTPFGSSWTVDRMYYDFNNQPLARFSRIADGVVHFKIQAFDMKGILLTNETIQQLPDSEIRISSGTFAPGEVGYYIMSNRTAPASIEFEMGILEPRAAERVRALSDTPSAATAYLEKQAGRLHVFRQRVSVRNVDPAVYP
jgi:prepilin-type N-terminal cleavage/methylation domain-containing protein